MWSQENMFASWLCCSPAMVWSLAPLDHPHSVLIWEMSSLGSGVPEAGRKVTVCGSWGSGDMGFPASSPGRMGAGRQADLQPR